MLFGRNRVFWGWGNSSPRRTTRGRVTNGVEPGNLPDATALLVVVGPASLAAEKLARSSHMPVSLPPLPTPQDGISQRKEAVKALQKLGLSDARLADLSAVLFGLRTTRSRRSQMRRYASGCASSAGQRPRFVWRRLQILLRRRELRPNHTPATHLTRRTPSGKVGKKRRVRFVRENVRSPVTRVNEEWGLDFIEDRLFNRRNTRIMTLEDRFSREASWSSPAFSMPAAQVIRELDAVAAVRSYPSRLRGDNGPGLTNHKLLPWTVEH
jgi:hypothetical protein